MFRLTPETDAKLRRVAAAADVSDNYLLEVLIRGADEFSLLQAVQEAKVEEGEERIRGR